MRETHRRSHLPEREEDTGIMDDETALEPAETAAPDERVQFWHRIGVASGRLLLFGVVVVVLRLLQVLVLHGKSEPGLFARCMGMAALSAFVIGTFLADLWVLHALVKGQPPGQAGGEAARMSPVASLLLTGRLGSPLTKSAAKDILSAKAFLALLGTLTSLFLLVLLWTYKDK